MLFALRKMTKTIRLGEDAIDKAISLAKNSECDSLAQDTEGNLPR